MKYTLDEIETFLAVMELGTITAVAARLNLSKSVISKRISGLAGMPDASHQPKQHKSLMIGFARP